MDTTGLQRHTDKSLLDGVREMYEDHLDTGDVLFKVGTGGNQVRVHRFILMCRSKVFFSMFTKQDPPKTALMIPNISKDVFFKFVE
jgi:hypothetical protein